MPALACDSQYCTQGPALMLPAAQLPARNEYSLVICLGMAI